MLEVRRTLYGVHFTTCTTVYIVPWNTIGVRRTLYDVHCDTTFTTRCAIFTVKCAVFTVRSAVYNLRYTMWVVQRLTTRYVCMHCLFVYVVVYTEEEMVYRSVIVPMYVDNVRRTAYTYT